MSSHGNHGQIANDIKCPRLLLSYYQDNRVVLFVLTLRVLS